MTTERALLVASDVVPDAETVARLLRQEFSPVHMSTDPAREAADFDACRPAVLVLAFDALERAERYYLGLFRLSTIVHALPHRTIILCAKDELTRVYELCRKQQFDDYVVFWPMAQDATRLPMAVHAALRQLGSATLPSAADFAHRSRRLAGHEQTLQRLAGIGAGHLDGIDSALRDAQAAVGAGIDRFGRELGESTWHDVVEVKDDAELQRGFSRLQQQVEPQLRAVAASLPAARAWADAVRREAGVASALTGELRRLSESVLPRVLLVDDDALQRRLLKHILGRDETLELATAESAAAALASMRRQRPDLVLLDVGLPDMDGIELTRRVKAIEAYAGVPIVMITGHSDKDVVMRSIKAGAADFIVKPVVPDTLLRKVRGLLGGHAAAAAAPERAGPLPSAHPGARNAEGRP